MATYYVSSVVIDFVEGDVHTPVTPSDSNNGLTPLTPKATLANLNSSYTLTSADTVNLAGLHVGSNPYALNWQQWAGQPRAIVCGSIDLSAGGGWSFPGNCWKKTLAPSLVLGQNATLAASITSVDALNPARCHCAVGHGLITGMKVFLAGLSVAPGTINGNQIVTVIDATTFSVPVDATGGVADGVGTWNLDRGNIVAAWNSRMDANGRHYGWYKTIQTQGSTRAGDTLNANLSYDYDETNGNFWIRDDSLLPSGVSPATLSGLDAVRRVPYQAQYCGIDIQSPGHYVVTGIMSVHFAGNHLSQQNGFRGQGDTWFRDCESWDAECHNFVSSADPTSNASTNARFINCHAYGCGSSGFASACFTFHNPAGGGTVTGAEADDDTAWPYCLLDPTGTEFRTDLVYTGFFSHVGVGGSIGVGATVGIAYSRCVTRQFNNPCNNINSDDTAALSGSALLGSSYPIISTECYTVGLTAISMTGNMWFARCTFPCLVGNNTDKINLATAHSVGFDACALPMNLNRGPGCNAFRVVAGGQLTFINTSSIVLSSGTNFMLMFNFVQPVAAFVLGSAGWKVNAFGSNFGFNGTGGDEHFIAFDNTAPIGNYNFVGCNYFQIPDPAFSDNTNKDTFAEWRAVVDTTALNVDPGYANPSSTQVGTAGYLASTSLLLLTANRLNTATHTTKGINLRPWKQVVGAFQDGGGGDGMGMQLSAGGIAILQWLGIIKR